MLARPGGLRSHQLNAERVRDPTRDLILQSEQIAVSLSDLSAQRCASLAASISWALTRTWLPDRRMLPPNTTIIQPGESANYNCSVVNFSQGCTTGWHTHNCDQVLVVTSGSGMVATEHEQRKINVGDVVHIKAGKRHWHGAKADTTMGHITITLAGSQATHG